MTGLAVIAAVASFAVPAPSIPIQVHDGPCPDGGGACAYDQTGDIYLDGARDQYTLAHEIGHLYLENLDGYWKGAIATHVTRGRWQWTNRTSERAADAYAACALRMKVGRRGRWTTVYDYTPTRRQQARVCSAIRRSSPALQETVTSPIGGR